MDSRSAQQTGRRWRDVSRQEGMQASDETAPQKLTVPWNFDPSGTRFEIAP